MSCSTCHVASMGWTGGVSGTNLHQVAITGATRTVFGDHGARNVGGLKPPSNAYASNVPFQANAAFPSGFRGGAFWNGRAEGADPQLFPAGATPHITAADIQNAAYDKYLGPVSEQALNPFGNPVEQNIQKAQVCKIIKSSDFAKLFTKAWGEPIDCTDTGLDKSFKRFAVSLGAWQLSSDVNSFTSKRDNALRAAGPNPAFPLAGLTEQENRGHALFYNTIIAPNPALPVTNCALCHSNRPGLDTGVEPEQTYTDFSYHVIGVPANPEIPGYPLLNTGLIGHTGIPFHEGAQKTPTLKNVDKRKYDAAGKPAIKAYTHAGWFKSLESLVHFYNTGALLGTAATFGITRCQGDMTEQQALKLNCWPAPEFPGAPLLALNPIIPTPSGPIPLIGDMGMTAQQEADLVAYLKTFTDAYTPQQPPPYK
jgi:cytochrome c peroxidase